ncbi:sensor histidine kinase [Teredinibacter franksiae]|uniref:sensor histidine kinase n=1 Tax=Teredinibacter franksiae TaxID=2761453 RepID=UPI001623C627|nr:HAMP domain-containing sensor histidine kinase [Teredinibacter franksiae]
MFQLTRTQGGDRRQILRGMLWLRVIALVGAFSMLAMFQLALARELDYPLLYSIAFAAVAYTIASFLRLRSGLPVTDLELLVHLLMDALILLVLVAFSGRATNPFIYYLLVLVAVSGTIFTRKVSWAFAALAVVAYTMLLYFDLEAHIHHLFSDFQLHLIGMWVNFVASTLLMNFFVSSLATALRDREVRLAHAREQTLKNEQLIGIGTLAASTVHALGTPLSTMAVMLGEMRAEQDETEDIELLLGQVDRCKSTLGRLSQLAGAEDQSETLLVKALVEQLQEHYFLANPAVMPTFNLDGSAADVRLHSSLSLPYALINLIDNAIRAARKRVSVNVNASEDGVHVAIVDDGAGVPEALVENFGMPTLSRQQGGLGIGIFLANTTIDKLGGKIMLFNPGESRSGNTTVLVELARAGEA